MRVLRWSARIASIASLALLTFFATSGGSMPSGFEWVLLAFFPLGVMVGMSLAWRREVLGGAITAASLAAFHVLLAFDSSRPAAGPWFVVFASPGLALLACGLLARRSGSARAAA